MITDRIRFTIIEVNTNKILCRDLVVKEPEVIVNLSGPSIVTFKVDMGQQVASAAGITFKTWGQWIVPEVYTDTYGPICMGAQLISKLTVDPKNGDLQVEGQGFMGYPKGIPWLENYNPIACDPIEVIQHVWAQLESYPNANLGVDVISNDPNNPSSTGTQMLPGFGFDGTTLTFNFWAIFVREADFNDAGDQITELAKDLPLDLFEHVYWDAGRQNLTKSVVVAYPYGGLKQDYLAFRLGENITDAEVAQELDIEPVSDVIVRSWLPGKVISSRLTNADMTRVRRVAMEEAVNLSDVERAAAWAKRKLTRRNIPKSFSKITIDPNHPNAPFGSYWLGDSIYVQAPGFPWVGDIEDWHRIISIKVTDKEPTIELGLKVEGAFNYDPIEYDPNATDQPAVDTNILPNGYFSESILGWTRVKGQWIRVSNFGYTSDGCVRIDCDDHGEELRSSRISINPGEVLHIQGAVKYNDITQSGGGAYTFAIGVSTWLDGGLVNPNAATYGFIHDGTGGFTIMQGDFVFPTDPTVANELSVSLLVNSAVNSGVAFWDDIKVLPPTDTSQTPDGGGS